MTDNFSKSTTTSSKARRLSQRFFLSGEGSCTLAMRIDTDRTCWEGAKVIDYVTLNNSFSVSFLFPHVFSSTELNRLEGLVNAN